MNQFKTRNVVLSYTATCIHKEWRNKRNHIISANGTGLLSYQGNMQAFKQGECIFLPKGKSVRLAVHSANNAPIVVTLYKHHDKRVEASLHLSRLMKAMSEVESSDISSKALVLNALDKLLEESARDQPIENTINKHYQEKITNMIRSDLKYRWSVDEVCKRLFITKPTMYRMFKKDGLSFSCILTNERLDAAKRLLMSTNASTESVAHECGFQSLSYFGKQFRSRFGITPSQYRKEYSS
ncbi:hypothetical protein VA249_14730 [Vibrio alfacsensis]|uniref:helix-turn-helix domain-containing protein n=1 Tax=Vibrio alfacsensis TaxID=1074311 RepID=UPI001BEDACB1|nr:AraC family transcriptional regulator [Vibrio alfacsensis]BBM64827.1 hypothetical protein VA249_14730 [Vibrio alfacsensis]